MVEVKRIADGKEYIVGYTCMMAPCHSREQGKVFKMFQVYTGNKDIAGDIHFFECIRDKWIWIRDYSFINLNGDPKLLDTYDKIPSDEDIQFETFERLIFYSLCLVLK